MYVPSHFTIDDRAVMLDIAAAHPLALLATNGPQGPVATQLPLLIETSGAERPCIIGHFARANPQWKDAQGTPALAVFRGADGYVTPDWYATKRATGKVVSTWNYITVQARGVVGIVEEPDAALHIVERLTDRMEGQRTRPWAVGDAPRAYIDAMMRGIVTFRIPVDDLVGQAKLSQNRGEADIAGVRAGLASAETGHDMLAAMDRWS